MKTINIQKKKEKKVLSLILEADLHEKIEALAKANGTTTQKIIRYVLETEIRNYK